MNGSRWFTVLIVLEAVAVAAIKWSNQMLFGHMCSAIRGKSRLGSALG